MIWDPGLKVIISFRPKSQQNGSKTLNDKVSNSSRMLSPKLSPSRILSPKLNASRMLSPKLSSSRILSPKLKSHASLTNEEAIRDIQVSVLQNFLRP